MFLGFLCFKAKSVYKSKLATSMEGEGSHDIPPLAEELLATDGWEKGPFSSCAMKSCPQSSR